MVKIDLREFYPYYTENFFAEISNEIAEEMHKWKRDEYAYQVGKIRNMLYYSLDRDDLMHQKSSSCWLLGRKVHRTGTMKRLKLHYMLCLRSNSSESTISYSRIKHSPK